MLAVAVSGDGRVAGSVGQDGWARLFHLELGNVSHAWAHDAPATALSLSAALVAVATGREVVLYNALAGREVARVRMPAVVTAVALSRDATRLLLADEGGEVQVVRAMGGRRVLRHRDVGRVSGAGWRGDDGAPWVRSHDGGVYEVGEHGRIAVPPGDAASDLATWWAAQAARSERPDAVDAMPGGPVVVLSAGEVRREDGLGGPVDGGCCVALHPSSELVLVGTATGAVDLWRFSPGWSRLAEPV